MKEKIDQKVVNGEKPDRDILAKGLKADLGMVGSLVYSLEHDKDLFEGLVDVYFKRWQAEYEKSKMDVQLNQNEDAKP